MMWKLLRYGWLVLGLTIMATSVSAKKKKVKQVVIEEVTRVEGKIQKPEVWYLLPRSNLKFEGVKLKKKLAPNIDKPAKKAPF